MGGGGETYVCERSYTPPIRGRRETHARGLYLKHVPYIWIVTWNVHTQVSDDCTYRDLRYPCDVHNTRHPIFLLISNSISYSSLSFRSLAYAYPAFDCSPSVPSLPIRSANVPRKHVSRTVDFYGRGLFSRFRANRTVVRARAKFHRRGFNSKHTVCYASPFRVCAIYISINVMPDKIGNILVRIGFHNFFLGVNGVKSILFVTESNTLPHCCSISI
jgi:hypothetical protein